MAKLEEDFTVYFPYDVVEATVLDNGTRIYCNTRKCGIQIFAFQFNVGARHDPKGREGLAHLNEHCMAAPCLLEATKYFERLCGGKNRFAATGYQTTQGHYMLEFSPDEIPQSLRWYRKIFFETSVADQLERQKNIITGEFKDNYPIPEKVSLYLRMARAVFGDHRLGRYLDPLGTPETFTSATGEVLTSFYHEHFNPSNLDVVAIGCMTTAEVCQSLNEDFFVSHAGGLRTECPGPWPDTPLPTETGIKLAFPDIYRGEPNHGEYISLVALPATYPMEMVRILSAMVKRVLLEEIREKREWTYGFNLSITVDPNMYALEFSAEDLPVEAMSEVGDAVEECIAGLANREDLFTHYLSAFNKDFRLGVYDFNGRKLRDHLLHTLAVKGYLPAWEEVEATYENMKWDQMQSLLAYLAPERRCTFQLMPS